MTVEYDREKHREKQKRGIAEAKARGVHVGRPIKKLPENFDVLVSQWELGEISTKAILAYADMSASTFYRRLRELRNKNE